MTYKQIKEELVTLLQTHAMIKRVLFDTPQEWMFANDQPDFPLCCVAINGGLFENGYRVYTVQFWFLDKSGQEGEFELDVINDQLEIAVDIVGKLRQSHIMPFVVEPTTNYTIISDAFEDYLAGVELTVTIKTIEKYEVCNFPSA